jgi:hypothetical protein
MYNPLLQVIAAARQLASRYAIDPFHALTIWIASRSYQPHMRGIAEFIPR